MHKMRFLLCPVSLFCKIMHKKQQVHSLFEDIPAASIIQLRYLSVLQNQLHIKCKLLFI